MMGGLRFREDTDVPKSVAEYIGREWLPHKEMWSAMSHQNHTIFEEDDTNMLLELYVITLLKKKKYYINKRSQISSCAKKHMAQREEELVC